MKTTRTDPLFHHPLARASLAAVAVFAMSLLLKGADAPPIQGRVKIENAEFSGNSITEVSGSGSLTNDKGQTIATNKLTVAEGWVALPGIKGSEFRCLPSDLADTLETHWSGEPQKELATVTLVSSTTVRLEDDRFRFLFDTSYGTSLALAASLARATELRTTNSTELALWGSKVSVGRSGGSVRIVRGKIVGGKNIKVTTPDNRITVFK
jgi:hypothetical protein